ncbi:MAG TPA: hypothetical protein VG754_03460 [Verrucomicrobiae bacterium]|nr:hypothetical protein [Verrucomicrobiae bacterium]
MTNPPQISGSPPRPKKNSAWKKWFTRLFILCAIATIAVIVRFSVWRLRLHREINARVASIRAKGLPINWEDLSHWPSDVPDSENAALIYTNAIAHIHFEHLTSKLVNLPMPGEKISENDFSLVKQTVDTNQEGLQLIYSAEKFTKARFPIDYNLGPDAKLPHLSGLRGAARLLAHDAFLKAERKDAEGAAKAAEASLHLSSALENEPLLISQLTSLSILNESCKSLERVLGKVTFSEPSLLRISTTLSLADATNQILTGLIGDRALNGEYIRLAQDDVRKLVILGNQGADEEDKADVPTRNPGFVWRYLGFFERDRNFYLRAMETNILAVTTPPPASLALTNEVDELSREAQNGLYISSSLFLPSYSRLTGRVATKDATIRTALAAIAIERWRNQHAGVIPDSLDSLVPVYLPSVPVDPYNGEPLKFRKTSKGYVIYSVGPDRQDDGGKPQPLRSPKKQRHPNEHYDITFTVDR